VSKVVLVLTIILIVAVGVILNINNEGDGLFQGEGIVKDQNQSVSVSLPDGVSITVPPRAVPNGTTVTIRQLDSNEIPEFPEWSNCAISVYEVNVDHPLQTLATVRFPLPKTDELSLLGHYHNGQWEIVPFAVEGNKAVVETANLSAFGWLEAKAEWFTDKMIEFLTLRWMEEIGAEPFCQNPSENIIVDDDSALGFISGCGEIDEDGKTHVFIRNEAPIYLDIYPIPEDAREKEGKIVEPASWLGVPSCCQGGMISPPRKSTEWVIELTPGDSITFEAYFTENAFAFMVYDMLPVVGKSARTGAELALFAHYGREATWADVKSFFGFVPIAGRIPFLAEFSQFPEELQPEHIRDRGQISFTRKATPTPEPSPTPPPTPEGSEGLVACWHFDENTGTTIYDSSGNGNDGTIYGATWATGISGSALSFGGEDGSDYVDLGNPTSLDISYPLTIEAWIKRASFGTRTTDSIISHGDGGYAFFLSKGTESRHPDRVVFATQGGGIGGNVESVNLIQDYSFHHVAVTYDGISGKIYIDGYLDNSASMSPTFNNIYSLRLGGCISYGEYFHGIIDEVCIYNRTLSASEIQAHYVSNRG